MTDNVLFDVQDGIGRLTLNRPEASNAVDLPTAVAIGAAADSAATDESVRVVLVNGNGKRFCAGGDVSSMVVADDRAGYLLELANELDSALQRLAALDKPVVAAVQGAVAGAGLGLMLSADIIIAERSTKFLTAYAGIGLTPDCGVSYLLPRAIGQQRALQFALTGRVLDGDEACEWGLVTEVVDGEARRRAEDIARLLATGPTFAYGQTRRLIRSSWDFTRQHSGADEARTISAAVDSPEAVELIEKFARAWPAGR